MVRKFQNKVTKAYAEQEVIELRHNTQGDLAADQVQTTAFPDENGAASEDEIHSALSSRRQSLIKPATRGSVADSELRALMPREPSCGTSGFFVWSIWLEDSVGPLGDFICFQATVLNQRRVASALRES